MGARKSLTCNDVIFEHPLACQEALPTSALPQRHNGAPRGIWRSGCLQIRKPSTTLKNYCTVGNQGDHNANIHS